VTTDRLKNVGNKDDGERLSNWRCEQTMENPEEVTYFYN
jgi:hypothetical protein